MCRFVPLNAVLHTLQFMFGFLVVLVAMAKSKGLMQDPYAGYGEYTSDVCWDWFRRFFWVFVMTSVGSFALGRAFLNWIRLLRSDGVAQVWPFHPMADLEPAVRQVVGIEVLDISTVMTTIQVAFIVNDYYLKRSGGPSPVLPTVDYWMELGSFTVVAVVCMVVCEILANLIRFTQVRCFVPKC